MGKRIISLVVLIALLLTLSGCTFYDFLGVMGIIPLMHTDWSLLNVMERVYDGDDYIGIRYNDRFYKRDNTRLLTVDINYDEFYEWYPAPNTDVLLSWNWANVAYRDSFWSDDKDANIFIHQALSPVLHLHEDYDYMSDIFVVEGTDAEIAFGDMFSGAPEDVPRYFEGTTRIVARSKNHPRIYVNADIYFYADQWYITATVASVNHPRLRCSDAFVALLQENGIIE